MPSRSHNSNLATMPINIHAVPLLSHSPLDLTSPGPRHLGLNLNSSPSLRRRKIRFFNPGMANVLTCRLWLVRLSMDWTSTVWVYTPESQIPTLEGLASGLPSRSTRGLAADLQKQDPAARDAVLAPSPPSSWHSRYRRESCSDGVIHRRPAPSDQTRIVKAVTGSREGAPEDDAANERLWPLSFSIAS